MRFPTSPTTETRYTHHGQASLPAENASPAFWLADAELGAAAAMKHHRTTAGLPRDADVVIIGSGISGTMAAWEFMGLEYAGDEVAGAAGDRAQQSEPRPHPNVVMLEAREACSGATGRNGGHCQALLVGNDPQVAEFELRNWERMRRLVERYQIPCEWQTHPNCHAYLDSEVFRRIIRSVQQLKAAEPQLAKHITVLTPGSTNPSMKDFHINPKAVGAVVMDRAANLWPHKFVTFLLHKMVTERPPCEAQSTQGSFNLQTTTPATSLQRMADGSWVVHTDRGMISAAAVLLATNAYTSYLVPSFSELIVPVQGQMCALMPPPPLRPSMPGTNRPGVSLQSAYGFVLPGKDCVSQSDYLMQRPQHGRELMFGGGRSYAANAGLGVSDDSYIEPDVAHYLRRGLYSLLDIDSTSSSNHKELAARYEWTGIMGFSRDARPWVGRVPGYKDGLWMCAGFTGHGMTNAPLCGKAVAQMMMTDDLDSVDLPAEYASSISRVYSAQWRHLVTDWALVDDDGTPLRWDTGPFNVSFG